MRFWTYIQRRVVRFKEVLSQGGVYSALSGTFAFAVGKTQPYFRQILPYTWASTTGVKHKVKLLDEYSTPAGNDDFEQPNVDILKEILGEEDTVCIVGGGFGLTARVSSDRGKLVWVFEPSKHHLDTYVRQQGNNIIGIHSYVADPSNAYGSPEDAVKLSPSDLPPCDVLEIDCEGGEQRILKELKIKPSHILVETHPEYGTDNEIIRQTLKMLDYQVIEFDDGDQRKVYHASKSDNWSE